MEIKEIIYGSSKKQNAPIAELRIMKGSIAMPITFAKENGYGINDTYVFIFKAKDNKLYAALRNEEGYPYYKFTRYSKWLRNNTYKKPSLLPYIGKYKLTPKKKDITKGITTTYFLMDKIADK